MPVSYTHLDVYKRQLYELSALFFVATIMEEYIIVQISSAIRSKNSVFTMPCRKGSLKIKNERSLPNTGSTVPKSTLFTNSSHLYHKFCITAIVVITEKTSPRRNGNFLRTNFALFSSFSNVFPPDKLSALKYSVKKMCIRDRNITAQNALCKFISR